MRPCDRGNSQLPERGSESRSAFPSNTTSSRPTMVITVAILTVSDTAFGSTEQLDRSGPALRNLLSSLPASPFSVVSSAIVPDEPSEIARVVRKWCDADIDLVLTSGGTGFGVRDRTPEVRAFSSLLGEGSWILTTCLAE